MERWKGTQMKNKQALAVLAGGLAMLGACASGNRDVGHEASAPRVLYSADALVFVSFDANDDLLVDAGEIEAGVTREWARAAHCPHSQHIHHGIPFCPFELIPLICRFPKTEL
jgi:hypothetical protein